MAVVLSLTPLIPDRAILAADLKEAVEQLSVQLSRSLPEGRTLRLAVTDFPDLQGITSDLGRYIAERLTTRLSVQTQKFRVVERRRLTQVLGELGFTMSGLVDPNKAKQLGNMLGVEAIVVGTVSDLGNVVDVDARIIEIETNNILPGVTVAINTDNTVRQMIERGREMPAPSAGVSPAGPPSSISLGTVKYQEFSKFRVEVEGLQVGPRGVTVFLSYVNKTQDELRLMLVGAVFDRTFLIDDAGNRYKYELSSGVSGDFHESYVKGAAMILAPGVRATASFTFATPREMEKKGSRFSFTSEQALIKPTISQMMGYEMLRTARNLSMK